MTATVIKGGGALSVAAVVPAAFYTYKARVQADGGTIVNETDCAAAFALIAKYGVTIGVAISPSWGVRMMDTGIDKFYGLLGTDMSNPFVPDTSGWRANTATTDSGFDAMQWSATWGYPVSGFFTITSSFVAMVAVRSPNANTTSEGYWATKKSGAAYHYTISNEPTGGSSRMRAQTGDSLVKTAYGNTKAALDRWKVSGMYTDALVIKSIEDGVVVNTTATTPGGFFLAGSYNVDFGSDVNGSGGYNLTSASLKTAEGWAIADGSLAFALDLNARMKLKYE